MRGTGGARGCLWRGNISTSLSHARVTVGIFTFLGYRPTGKKRYLPWELDKLKEELEGTELESELEELSTPI